MATLRVELITGEGILYEGRAKMVSAPGAEGQLGILPHHAPLISALVPGELRLILEDRDESFAVSGGVMEVRDDRVIILADTAERADEIDVKRAEAARQRALISQRRASTREEYVRAGLALQRSRVRLRVARRRGKR